MSTHILYITYDGLTDTLGQSQVLPYVMGLEEKGYTFSILSFEKPSKYPAEKGVVEELLKGKNITWYPKMYHKRFSILATVWDILTGLFFIHTLMSRQPFRAVHCRSYISAVIGMYAKNRFGVRFIFDMRGFWADERVDGGLWNLNNPIFKMVYSFFKWIEKKAILNADYVVTLTQASYLEMKTWSYVTDAVKFKIIPCCVDLNVFSTSFIDSDKLNQMKTDLDIGNKTVLSYLGSIGTWYMMDEMFAFFKILRSEKPDAVFLIITPEREEDILRMAARNHVPSTQLIIRRAQRKDVPYYLSLSSASVFFIRPTYSKISSFPTKMAEIMAMGIPLICNAGIGDVDQQVKEAKAGICLTEMNTASYTDAVEKWTQHTGNYFNRTTSINYVDRYFSLHYGVTSYFSIYQEILK